MHQSGDISVAASDKPMLVPGVISRREADGRHMLFNPETMNAHFISDLGWNTVQLCTGRNTVEQIIARIVQDTGECIDRLRPPVTDFIEQLCNRRLLLINPLPDRSD